MTIVQSVEPHPRQPLRVWPGIAAVVLLWLLWVAVPAFVPGVSGPGMLAGLGCGLAVFAWWLFFSRAPWLDRIGAILLMVAGVLAVRAIVHPSISNGMMGLMLPIYSIPLLCLALVASAAAGRGWSNGARRGVMGAAILVACGAMALVRTGGVTGDGESDLHWRWTPTPEERLLAQAEPAPAPVRDTPAAAAPPATVAAAPPDTTVAPPAASTTSADPVAITGEWPGFRGAERDGVIRGVRLDTDWVASPPVEVWRRPIGPGWSSFAVHGDLVYTQEQRGEEELVSCYRLSTGRPVWRHSDPVRFYESNGGPGPRATPAVRNGRVYAMGATGILNVLDAARGTLVWSRNAQADTGAQLPGWGFAGSPLVTDDAVIVAASGRLAAYDLADGDLKWTATTSGGGYSSPHLATVGGAAQILLLSGGGVTSVSPADGTVLWQQPGADGVSIVQPSLAPGGDVLVAGGDMMGGTGIRRVGAARGPSGWTVQERWASRGLKPYFNDFVVHEGHAYGFDGTILSCIDLEDGERKWKGGRYGAGQLLLLSDQDVLLVLSEEGEVALVSATPDKHTELAKFKAIEGKTWNHPVLAGDLLLVRNGEEMAAFRLPTSR